MTIKTILLYVTSWHWTRRGGLDLRLYLRRTGKTSAQTPSCTWTQHVTLTDVWWRHTHQVSSVCWREGGAQSKAGVLFIFFKASDISYSNLWVFADTSIMCDADVPPPVLSPNMLLFIKDLFSDQFEWNTGVTGSGATRFPPGNSEMSSVTETKLTCNQERRPERSDVFTHSWLSNVSATNKTAFLPTKYASHLICVCVCVCDKTPPAFSIQCCHTPYMTKTSCY